MGRDEQQLQRLTEALADHSAEGVAILASEPSRLIQGIILLIAALLLTGLVWSFIGRADVIVSVTGSLRPDSDVTRLYAPIDGELVDIFIAEGQPVEEGEVLARLNAREAIRIAANYLEADLSLASAKREFERFAQRRERMERMVEAIDKKIAIAQRLHEQRMAEGLVKLGGAQRARLQEARANLEQASRGRDVARGELAKLQRLFNREGGGGVSRDQVEQARSVALAAEADFSVAQARLGELEFLLSREYGEAKAGLEGSDQELVDLQLERDARQDEIEQEQHQVELGLRLAQLEADAASRVRLENIDEDNFLLIRSPAQGVVTEVNFTQRGDKIQASQPMGGIAASDARAVLKVEIPEADRAFLRVGQLVKLKFNAFPYQRYGFVDGELEYISPSTRASDTLGMPVYRGTISLQRDYFEIQGERLPLRYGMAATAEIVVRKRRIFDLILDPFRDLKG